ncbi:MAG: ATPase, T2SS/T4P/T4SS family [Erysipelotrichaceae bacterium]|nr:ATPase, T2SS/T4P/T4SS family [Erysipelotrichaceae bacterium]
MEKIAPVYKQMDLAYKDKSKELNGKISVTIVSKDDPESIEKINSLIKELIAEKYENELKSIEVAKGSKLENDIYNTLIDFLNKPEYIFIPHSFKAEVINNFMLGLSGYGILQPLMDDDSIEDIYIYAPDKIYYLKDGRKYKSDIEFETPEKLKAFVDNTLGRINRTINNKNPIEDGRLPDGSRIAVSAEVLSPNGNTINIRKFKKERITLDTLVANGAIDEWMKDLLIKIIESRMNFLVSGGTSSGKTTMLNAMAQYIDPYDNVTTIEDNIELQLNRDFWLQLETRKANIEGNGEVKMEDLLVHLLRRSPDRIVVGEIRSGAVADTFMNAIQTGHDGTCATIHANNPERCRSRMCKLASVASGQPFKAAQDDFDHSINIIIQLKRDEVLHKRLCTSIDFVNENGKLSNLAHFDKKTMTFVHNPLPEVLKERFEEYGLEVSE